MCIMGNHLEKNGSKGCVCLFFCFVLTMKLHLFSFKLEDKNNSTVAVILQMGSGNLKRIYYSFRTKTQFSYGQWDFTC